MLIENEVVIEREKETLSKCIMEVLSLQDGKEARITAEGKGREKGGF